jgi:hypothetical protein
MHKEIKECRACGRDKLELVLDLGNQPPANSYHKEGETLEEFPLALNVCQHCFHGQLSVVVDPDSLFKHYLYVSGTSTTLKDYFEWFVNYAENRYGYNGTRPLKVLDIACNDGSQLDAFKAVGHETFGIDPAQNIVPTAIAKGHKVICDYLTPESISSLEQYKFDIIIAQNVFAHTHDIFTFLQTIKPFMEPETVVLIQTSQANMFLRNEFDTIYHEHLSFFNTKSMRSIADRVHLHLNNVDKTDIHGTSYVFELSLSRTQLGADQVAATMLLEEMEGLYNMETYKRFAQNAVHVTKGLKEYIEYYRLRGDRVLGYGAAAKGMTVLNFGEIDLDGIIDDNPLKQGLLTPGRNIPIYDSSILTETPEDIVIVPLAWNFFDEIRQRIGKVRPRNGDILIQYFPELVLHVG